MIEKFLLVIIRQHQAFTPSPFNCYHKSFVDHEGKTAEDWFWEWWNQLPERSYTKRVGKVQFMWCLMDHVNPLENPVAPVIPMRSA